MKPEGSRHHRSGPEIGAESGYLFPGSAGRLKSLFQELALNELDAVTAPETGQVLITGSQVCSTDDKGRLIIPKRIR
ncbi:MAG: hypothetical protein KDD70_18440, partial [Bdellovibrionales bacterium]|nr:hypothetical protein [Bdellovibrionales bacterium]